MLATLSKAARDRRAAARCGCRRCDPRRAPGACIEGSRRHQPVAVTALDGERIGWICERCYVRLRGLQPPGIARLATDEQGRVVNPECASWFAQADDGTPLPELPNPRACIRPRAHRPKKENA